MRQTLAALASFVVLATPAVADGPVVVELYTSQGCSSCPPADEMMHELAKRDDLIALALHVDYWDYIGWADSFASPAHTQRQQAYARAAGASTIYTPQMVIGGQDHVVGTKPMDVADLIQAHRDVRTGVQVDVTRSGDSVRIAGQSDAAFGEDAIVQLVRFDAESTVDIRRGENAGNTFSYANVVTDWDVVGAWDGRRDLDLSVQAAGDAPVVVIIQRAGMGAILASDILR